MEKLIEMVKGFPVLYDTSHEDYMRTKLKDDLWEKIAKEFNTSGHAVKDQWRKLRECHREALRRQQKKSGQQATRIRLWTYQKQMHFLRPFMKNKNTVGNPTSSLEESQFETLSCEESQFEELDIPPSDGSTIEATNDGQTTEPSEKKFKKSTNTNDPIMFNEDSDKGAKKRDESHYRVAETQEQKELRNDALYQFFMSMYNITKGFPRKYQREVRRALFQAVSEAEDKVEDEITDECEGSLAFVNETNSSLPEIQIE